jgi:molecular chaperone DnaK
VPAVGIDLGTTYSVVAFLDPQGRPTCIPNSDGDLLTPSVVVFDDDGVVVGKQAVAAASLEPEKVAESAKRDMGSRHYHKQINGQWLPPEVISAYILKRLKADAERKIGPISKAVITVPAYFDETRRRATMDAGKLAGLDVLDIINEPTAAAIVYGYQTGLLDRSGGVAGGKPLRVLVFDLGGGTFDVTLVEIGNQSFKALATDGDVLLGGKDWDQKLVEIAAERLKLQIAEDPREDPATLHEMIFAAEAAKRTLSERTKATMVVNYRGRRFKVDVTREEFEEATLPLVIRTRTSAELVVLQGGSSWQEIDRVLVVGGSTRMPMILRMLGELAGGAVDHSLSPDEAVAQGAALYADLVLRRQGSGGGHTQFSVTNINAHSLGVVGVKAKTGSRVNRIIIRKNTPLPRSKKRRFKTYKANQKSVKVTVLEGDTELPDECVEVGTCVISDLPPNLPAGWPVEVRYTYRENGRLHVSAKLIGDGAKVTAEFIRENSLSDNDLLLWSQVLADGIPAPAADDSDAVLRLLLNKRLVAALSRAEVAQLRLTGRIAEDDLICALSGPWMKVGDFLAPRAAKIPGAPLPTNSAPAMGGAPLIGESFSLVRPTVGLSLSSLNKAPLADEWFVRVRGIHSATLAKRHVKALFEAKEITCDNAARHATWPDGEWLPIREIPALLEALS